MVCFRVNFTFLTAIYLSGVDRGCRSLYIISSVFWPVHTEVQESGTVTVKSGQSIRYDRKPENPFPDFVPVTELSVRGYGVKMEAARSPETSVICRNTRR